MPMTSYLRHGFMLRLSCPFSDWNMGSKMPVSKSCHLRSHFQSENGIKYSWCTGTLVFPCLIALHCFIQMTVFFAVCCTALSTHISAYSLVVRYCSSSTVRVLVALDLLRWYFWLFWGVKAIFAERFTKMLGIGVRFQWMASLKMLTHSYVFYGYPME